MIRHAAFLAISLILIQSARAQQSSQTVDRSRANSQSASGSKTEEAVLRRQVAVSRVRDFAERILAFNDIKIKTIALARIANLLWVDDEPYARQLFIKAVDLSAPQNETSSTSSKLKPGELAYLRRHVITQIALRDAALAKRLTEADTISNNAANRAQTNAEVALDHLISGDSKSAAAFAESSLQSGVSPWIVSVLQVLRRKDEPSANALFLKTLERLVTEPVVDADNLLYLGTYVFTSPKADPQRDSVIQVGVGRILVYDITADRPNIPPGLVRAYLEAATQILTRRISNANQRPHYYAACYLMLPKAKKFAPNLTPYIAAAMHALASDVPQELTQESTYKNLAVTAPKDLDESLREIEDIPDEDSRDARYLSLVFSLWHAGNYTQARSVATRLRERDARDRLAILIDFGEAARSLDRGETAVAEETAGKLPIGIERAVLWLAVSRRRTVEGDSRRAAEAIDNALASANKVNDARRPFLLLNAAGQLAHFHKTLASSTLAEAIREFNRQQPEALAKVEWRQKIEAGPLWRDFPLKVKGVEFGFVEALPSLVSSDVEGVVAAVNDLKVEGPKAQALLALAAAVLK